MISDTRDPVEKAIDEAAGGCFALLFGLLIAGVIDAISKSNLRDRFQDPGIVAAKDCRTKSPLHLTSGILWIPRYTSPERLEIVEGAKLAIYPTRERSSPRPWESADGASMLEGIRNRPQTNGEWNA